MKLGKKPVSVWLLLLPNCQLSLGKPAALYLYVYHSSYMVVLHHRTAHPFFLGTLGL